ncbi:MAG: hypothetical protein WBW80_22325 [Acidimicrobiales bacterium]
MSNDQGTSILPAQFEELEPFSSWSLAREAERYGKRLASSMEEVQAFYDAAFPRTEEAISYIDQFDFAALPEDATRLLWLYYSLTTVSFPVEVWRQTRVPDSGAASFDCVVEPAL